MNKAIVMFRRHGSRWDPDKPVREQEYWDEHARFMDSLFEAGKVLLGGPFADGSGSMLILTVESEETAREIFREDPWEHLDVLVTGEVKEWTIFLDGRGNVELL